MADALGTQSAPATETDSVEHLVTEGAIGANAAGKALGGVWRQTVARYMLKGVKLPDGRLVKLAHFRRNGRLMTSKAACLRFLKAQQTEDHSYDAAQEVKAEAQPSRRLANAKAAGKKLESLGA